MPVTASIDNPDGRSLEDHVTTGPPEFAGASTVVIAVLRSKVIADNVPNTGAISITVMEILDVAEPPVFSALIVESVAP